RGTAKPGANPVVPPCWHWPTGCLFAPLLFSSPPSPGGGLAQASVAALSALSYLGLVVSVGVYILSNYALRHLPVGRMGLYNCLVGPIGTALSALLIGTEVSPLDGLALAMVIVAVLLPSLVGGRVQVAD